MKTEQLIALLAAGEGRVRPLRVGSRAAMVAALGALLAVPLMLALLGVNPQLASAARQPMFWAKLLFVAAIVAAAALLFARLARPGAALARAPLALAVPLMAMWLLALFALAQAAPAERSVLIFGVSWNACPYYIALLALPALAIGLSAMRGLAPTRLRLAGGAAGLLAGAVGALVYALHCPELAAPFLGVWYVLGMLVPTLLGAALGPRLLRW